MGRTLGASPYAVVLNQDIYEVSATQKHRLGTRFARGERAFVYAKAGATLNVDLLASAYNAQMISFASAPVAAAVGASQISMTVGASDGPAANGALAVHYLEGGYLVCFSDSVDTFLMGIKDNTVVASGGGTTVLTLDGEIPIAIATADSSIEATASPYVDVRTTNMSGMRPFLGAPMRSLTTTYPYGWLQTWGPSWIAPQAAVGVAANVNTVVARHDGSLDIETTSGYEAAQVVGYVLTRVTAGTQGAPFIFLTISR